MIPNGISDKYEVIRILQETAATAVLLVNYKQIGAPRIIKAVHRAHPDAHSILSEAHLLQGINSSQIPTIFSVEDTSDMYYLIEEYVEGLSLREYLLENKLSKEELLNISTSLCKVMEAIHNANPEPVLYRDMKPEHVILQGDKVRLIDFGIAIRKSEAAKAKPLGTVNWAAPEQLKGQNLDERCDVYGVGKIIEFMQINSYAKDDFRIKKLINQATDPDMNKRTKSISILKEQLLDLQGVRAKKKEGIGGLDRTIGVVGTDHSVGTTLIAINLCRFLNKKGIDAYYKDLEKDTVHNLMENLKEARIREGVLYHGYFKGLLNYGEAIDVSKSPQGLYVYDCGTNNELAENCDMVIVITGGRPWQKCKLPSWIKSQSVYVISNFSTKLRAMRLAKEIKKQIYMYPIIKTSKDLTKEEERIFSRILRNEKG